MEPATTLTLSGILAIVISAITTYLVHKALVGDVYEVLVDLEKSRVEHEKRQKAQIVAELLSLWQYAGGVERTAETRRELNELSYQCSLWLPSNILSDLAATLTHSTGAKHVKEILADVRFHLGNDRIDPGVIVHFP